MDLRDYAAEIMPALYRKLSVLPSLIPVLLLYACDAPPVSERHPAPVSDTYLEALQEVEALKHSIDEQRLEQQRIDALLDGSQSPAR